VGVMLVVVKVVGGKASRHFRKQQQAVGELNGYVEEMVAGQKVVKVFCHEKAAAEEFGRKNEKLRSHASIANALSTVLMPVLMNIGNLQYVLIAVIGGALALHGIGGITLGTIAAFLTLSKAFSAPIGQMSSQINIITMALAGAERIFKLLDEPAEVDEGYVTLVNAEIINGVIREKEENTGSWAWRHPHGDGSVTYTELKGDVRFFEVDFSYDDKKIVLHNVSLYAEPGQKIAFVGATGAGKTTITNLINRFYDIADGKIRFDGINVNKIKKADLRGALGIVLQDTHLFTGTITENIQFGNLAAKQSEIIAAARLAGAHEFISRLPQGYDTVITSDGGCLSGGQRQLLAIARAAVANPPVMILDEATSSIDTRTEAIVQQGMDRLMENRTVFVIAHRLSTVRNADAILVMENGSVIERGNHEALVAQKGKYYQLYTGKMQ
jgi:ATP-binding cassette subfamily B protein